VILFCVRVNCPNPNCPNFISGTNAWSGLFVRLLEIPSAAVGRVKVVGDPGRVQQGDPVVVGVQQVNLKRTEELSKTIYT
jgi:hypothetical protein